MANNKQLRVLFVGIDKKKITFLDRLIEGLINSKVHVLLTNGKFGSGRGKKQGETRPLWTPPIKGPLLRQVFSFIYLLLSTLGSNHHTWIKEQVKKGHSLKDKFGYFMRYAPFCQGNFDVIYFPWNSTAITYLGLFELGKPVVVSCRGSQINIRPHLPGQQAYIEGLRETFQKAAAVHCVSEDIQQAAYAFGLDRQKAYVISPAVDPDSFTPAIVKSTNKQLKLITTGSLIWRKGYEYMLMAVRQLLDKGVDADLHILGHGPMEESILFMIEDLNLSGRVHLHGKVNPEEVRKQLQTSDIFVLSSLSEGISNAVLEAMSCGLPVVCTDCGGMSEAIRDGTEGFLVPMRDPEAMANALFKLFEDGELRQTMGSAGRKRVVSQFMLEDQVDAFITLFNTLLK